jgi:hypothetical protein
MARSSRRPRAARSTQQGLYLTPRDVAALQRFVHQWAQSFRLIRAVADTALLSGLKLPGSKSSS